MEKAQKKTFFNVQCTTWGLNNPRYVNMLIYIQVYNKSFRAQRKCYPKKLVKRERERERLETSIKNVPRSFWERQTDNGAFRGAVWNEKRSPRVHCILGKLHTKNEGLKWYDLPFFLTDRHCGI